MDWIISIICLVILIGFWFTLATISGLGIMLAEQKQQLDAMENKLRKISTFDTKFQKVMDQIE